MDGVRLARVAERQQPASPLWTRITDLVSTYDVVRVKVVHVKVDVGAGGILGKDLEIGESIANKGGSRPPSGERDRELRGGHPRAGQRDKSRSRLTAARTFGPIVLTGGSGSRGAEQRSTSIA